MTEADLIRLVPMRSEHLDTTYIWLTQFHELRERIDCLAAPTREGNIGYWTKRWVDPKTMNFSIIHDRYGHVGNCGLSDLDLIRRKAQLWVYLGKCQDKGIGKIAVLKLLQNAFEEQNLIRIYLRVLIDNKRAIDFYRMLGFIEEGYMRCDTFRDGSSVDALLFSMLATEYKNSSSTCF